jgi:hypothetical protein
MNIKIEDLYTKSINNRTRLFYTFKNDLQVLIITDDYGEERYFIPILHGQYNEVDYVEIREITKQELDQHYSFTKLPIK